MVNNKMATRKKKGNKQLLDQLPYGHSWLLTVPLIDFGEMLTIFLYTENAQKYMQIAYLLDNYTLLNQIY